MRMQLSPGILIYSASYNQGINPNSLNTITTHAAQLIGPLESTLGRGTTAAKGTENNEEKYRA